MAATQQNARASLPPPKSDGGSPETNQERQQRLFKELRADLNRESFRKRIADCIPTDFRQAGYVDRLCESIFIACRDNPTLLTGCDRASLFRAAERIAKKGLTVGDNVAWLVPYKQQVQDQIGWKGTIILATRSGLVERYTCQPVFSNDKCEILLGTENRVTHAPPMRGPRGDFIGAYAIVWFKDCSEPDIEWMDRETVDFIRSLSPGKNSPAWQNWYTEMARAKVFKRLMKRAPAERPLDMDDMDDRMAKTIEGTGEEVSFDAPAIEAPTDQPIDMNGMGYDQGAEDEREPARQADDVPGEPPAKPAGTVPPSQQQAPAKAKPAADTDDLLGDME